MNVSLIWYLCTCGQAIITKVVYRSLTCCVDREYGYLRELCNVLNCAIAVAVCVVGFRPPPYSGKVGAGGRTFFNSTSRLGVRSKKQ